LVFVATADANEAAGLAELATLLHLQPGLGRYDLIVSQESPRDPVRANSELSSAIHVAPRSSAQVFFYLANGVEVPDEHLKAGIVGESRTDITQGVFRVKVATGRKQPSCAYQAVRYRDYWYYIDDRDHETKATFALMLQLTRLDFARQRLDAGPILTLPAGR